MDPVCTKSGGATGGVPDSCQSRSNSYFAEPLSSTVRRAVVVRSGALTSRDKLGSGRVDVVGDAAAVRIVTDVGEKIDVAAQSGQSDRDVQWAPADVLADDPVAVLDDVDECFADHQSAAHCTNASNVARAPLLCNESSVQR